MTGRPLYHPCPRLFDGEQSARQPYDCLQITASDGAYGGQVS